MIHVSVCNAFLQPGTDRLSLSDMLENLGV
jgi:hypothetical protein